MTVPQDLIERVSRCPHCGLNWQFFPPARITNFDASHKQFETGDARCVECKTLFTPSDLASTLQSSEQSK